MNPLTTRAHHNKAHPLKNLPDERLIEDARNGNVHAFETLVKRYEQMVYGFSFKMCRNKEKADETLQDTFINVYKNLQQFNGNSKFSTWLYSIVTNNCLMNRRKRKMDQEMVSLDEPPVEEGAHHHGTIPSWEDTPAEKMMNTELRSRLDTSIQKLPQDYRVVFILRDIEGQSIEETAQILKLSIPAVKSRLRRARIFLREQLNDYMVQ
ncbi:MAG: sigma-70 family RNA polymerase sigma factor [Ignavibacteriales bacterium]|nr:sigma-70 family RNA polymerase sigma factor [Ignavibacteriales bacterium]